MVQLGRSLRLGPVAGASVVAAVAMLVITAAQPPGVPFIRFPAFSFPDTGGVMAVPLFLADGVPAKPDGYTDFSVGDTERIDVRHGGLPSVVEHRFHELRDWVVSHPGDGGPVGIVIGTRVLRRQADGSILQEDLVATQGTARAR